ncbi:MAG: hypothetical protein AB7Q29_05710 [Vicinamibacterales bacterium]
MSPTAQLHFVPWLRTGAAGAIATADTLAGSIQAAATIEPWIRIAGRDVSQTISVRGPGHVIGVGPQAVVRVEPTTGAGDFEPNYFPHVELRPADLPWRFTPAAPAGRDRLRPWLALVVVQSQDGVSIGQEPGALLPVLRVDAPARPSVELPDLSDSSAWAHVQSTVPPADLPAAFEDDPAVAVARLICPRRLVPNASWLACLVPAFDVGVQAGLGASGADAADARPAWDISDPALDQTGVRLPVYHWWSFTTAAGGDFESLARRLAPDGGEAVLGRAAMDVTKPGPPLPDVARHAPVMADYVGALKSVGLTRRPVPADYQDRLEAALEPILERGAGRVVVPAGVPPGYDPATDDPVVAPPLYGSLQTGATNVPPETHPTRAWMRALNVRLPFRAAAGLGADVVRRNQESLVASAWAQAGEAREASRALDRGLLAAESGRSIARRLATSDDGAIVQTTRFVHPWIASPASSNRLSVDLQSGSLPRGLVSAPFARATRPRTSLGRSWTRRAPADTPPPFGSATRTFISATSATAPQVLKRTLDFAATDLPAGAWVTDPALDAEVSASLPDDPGPATPPRGSRPVPSGRPVPSRLRAAAPIRGSLAAGFDGTRESAVRLDRTLSRSRAQISAAAIPLAAAPRRAAAAARAVIPVPRVGGIARPAAPAALDLSSSAAAVIAGLDPLPRIQSGLLTRVPGLSAQIVGSAWPRRLTLAPVFTDPLYRDLVRIDPRYLIPGVEALGDNRVALLDVDNGTVAAFLAGANHEMSRELVWREFPTLPSHTFFRRFWAAEDGQADDTGPIAGWTKAVLGDNLAGVGASDLCVMLVRGDLLRRYPSTHVYVCRGVWDGTTVRPDDTRIAEAVLQGSIDRRTSFFGFPIAAADLRGDRRNPIRTGGSAGWFIVFEEPATGPRFGLDTAADDGSDLVSGAAAWNDLSWGHLVPPQGSIEALTHVNSGSLPIRTPRTIDGVTWGRNAAHMAAITWQRPFRLYVHADRLLPR